MVDLLTLTILLPLLGAGSIFFVSFLLLKYGVEETRFLALAASLAVAGLALVFVCVLKGSDGLTAELSAWTSALLAESVLKLRLDALVWPVALALSVATCFLLLADLGRGRNASPRLAAVSLVLLGAALAALWTASPLTTIISWALYDLFLLLGQIAAGCTARDAVRSLAAGCLSGLLLTAGVFVHENGMGTVQWVLMPPGGASTTVWLLAALLRIGAYPVHGSIPGRVASSSPLVTALRLSPVIGWGLLLRLLVVGDGVLAVGAWAKTAAFLTLAAGGFLGWTAKSSDAIRRWIGVAGSGAVLLGAVMASVDGTPGVRPDGFPMTVALGAASWVFGMTVLHLGGGLERKEVLSAERLPCSLPSLLGAMSLIGAPLTLGLVTGSSVLRGLVREGQWGWGVGFFVGQAWLVAAVARWLFPPDPPRVLAKGEGGRFGEPTRVAALLGPALSLALAGVAPSLLLSGSSGLSLGILVAGPGPIGWLLWATASLLGGIIRWQDANLRPGLSHWLDVLHDFVRLDWAYDLVVGTIEQGFAIVRVVDDILGGKAALLWSLILLLILILVGRFA
ncbi:MAG: hypothetical protein PVF54_04440 [Anaerolineae bacterium]|jgi:hypothetical protein